MSYMNPEKKMDLGVLYAQCQEYVHDYNEILDKQIVSALHLTDNRIKSKLSREVRSLLIRLF